MIKLFTLSKATSLLILLFLFSCQKEEVVIISNPSNKDIISSGFPLTDLISRVVQSPTSIDNVLDKSSCIGIQLPVSIVVNGQAITITDNTGYLTVKNIINAYGNDDDLIHFVYPITVKFRNFTSQIVTNKIKLDEIIDCDDDDLDDISCISINYPISVAVYDTNSQLATTKIFENNTSLFAFITNGLKSNIVATINYPISVKNKLGENTVINSNAELENFIENSIGDCDDDTDTNPDFDVVFTSSSWYISHYKHEYDDQTTLFSGYNFNFNTNKTSLAVKKSSSISGTWSTEIDDGTTRIELHYDGDVLEKIEEDWKLVEYSSSSIKLRHDSDYLTFTKL